MKSKINDVIQYFLKSRHWMLIVSLLILATLLSILFVYKADNTSETNLVNTITIITTALAFALLFSDFHRNWRESREKRLTALIYEKNSKGQPTAVMFYYRATLGGESDIRALSQQLGREVIESGIGQNKGQVHTQLNLSVASNQYTQLPKILQDEKGTMVQDHIAITALYNWVATACPDGKDIINEQTIMKEAMLNKQIYFAKGDSDESEWGFATWEQIAKKIAPEIKQKVESYGIENNLIQFNRE